MCVVSKLHQFKTPFGGFSIPKSEQQMNFQETNTLGKITTFVQRPLSGTRQKTLKPNTTHTDESKKVNIYLIVRLVETQTKFSDNQSFFVQTQ